MLLFSHCSSDGGNHIIRNYFYISFKVFVCAYNHLFVVVCCLCVADCKVMIKRVPTSKRRIQHTHSTMYLYITYIYLQIQMPYELYPNWQQQISTENCGEFERLFFWRGCSLRYFVKLLNVCVRTILRDPCCRPIVYYFPCMYIPSLSTFLYCDVTTKSAH